MLDRALPRPFGRYTLLRRLAHGGMAEVYLAKAAGPEGFEKQVAVKCVPSWLGADAPPSSTLASEAALAVQLDHPNIVQTFDLGRAEGGDFIVMEHVEGRDLERTLAALRRDGVALPIDLAAYVMAETCRGLDYAHRKPTEQGTPAGIVHRDLSPPNILLSLEGLVKVADFGIAKSVERRGDSEARVIKGKYAYMSPEQARAEPLDRRSDVFSAGVVLWELLVGRRLRDATEVASLLASVRAAEVPPPSTERHDVPHALDAVVARATAIDRDERYPDAAAMADDLDAFLGSRRWGASSRLAALIGEHDPSVPAPPAAVPVVPETRRGVTPATAARRATPADPPLRHDLSDGRVTVVGKRAPAKRVGTGGGWLWAVAAGALGIGLCAWIAIG